MERTAGFGIVALCRKWLFGVLGTHHGCHLSNFCVAGLYAWESAISPRASALRALAERLPPDLLGEALAAARQIQDERYRAEALRDLIPLLGAHPQLWKPFWAELRLDLLRSRPYRIAENTVARRLPVYPWELLAHPQERAAFTQKSRYYHCASLIRRSISKTAYARQQQNSVMTG